MNFYHCTENKEIRRRGNFDIFHGANDSMDSMPIVTHHGAGINEVISAL